MSVPSEKRVSEENAKEGKKEKIKRKEKTKNTRFMTLV